MRNQKGSALIIALVAVAVLSAVAVIGTKIAGQSNQQSQALQTKLNSARFASYIQVLLSDPNICKGVVTSAPNASGLAFFSSSSSGASQQAFAGAGTQQIQLGTNLKTTKNLKAGVLVPEFELKVKSLSIESTGTAPNFSGVIRVQVTDLAGNQGLAEQTLPSALSLVASAPGSPYSLQSCQMQIDASAVCHSLGCDWNTTRTPKCLCELPALDCTTPDSVGYPSGYVRGYTADQGVISKICMGADYTCPAGKFFQGFDEGGHLLCQTATTAGATPTPALCGGVPKPAPPANYGTKLNPAVAGDCSSPIPAFKQCGGAGYSCQGAIWVWENQNFCAPTNLFVCP